MAAERVIYIIDDDPAICRSLERLLDAAGFPAVVEVSFREARQSTAEKADGKFARRP